MTTYRRVWQGAGVLVAALGIGLAVLESSGLFVVTTLGLLAVLGWLVTSLLPGGVRGSVRTPAGPHRPRWRPHPLTVAIGIVTVGSISRVSPPLGLLVVLAGALTSPTLLGVLVCSARRGTAQELRRPATHRPDVVVDTADDGVLTPPEALGPLNGLDERQLCRLWRESFWVLRNPAPPGDVLRLVALREACLAELERRDAAALQAWIDGGARASSGPEKYLSHPRPPGPDAAPHPPGEPR